MGTVIAIAFVSLDGYVTDPDGSGGTPYGGWAFRHGPEAVGGDKFRLGALLDDGVLLLGRRTWELFSGLFPQRADDFSTKMNKIPKLVASHRLTDVSGWSNSTLVDGDVVDAVRREERDVVVTGSSSVIHLLQEHELIDEYRLLTFPSIVGAGERLFGPTSSPVHLTCVASDQAGAAVLTQYRRA
ncbi:dihydrofolate reductase family protein [Kribbella koreensis]|uniref:Dihydrofolate reductase family protein n=1 Tax=Kribbella koreensis TaxID=57909 RepID=A0ABN1QKQ8_9ACTN